MSAQRPSPRVVAPARSGGCVSPDGVSYSVPNPPIARTEIPESWQHPDHFVPDTCYMVVQRMMGAWRPFFHKRRVELHLSLPAAKDQLKIAVDIYGADRVRIAKVSPSLDGLLSIDGLPSEEDLDAVAAEAAAKARTAPDSTSPQGAQKP